MLTKAGGLDALRVVELPLSDPGPGELCVRVQAAGVGATDLMMLDGSYPFAPKIPFVLGYEAAGVVDAVGAGVSGFAVGQRVAALTVWGAFAEYLVRGAEHFVPIPDAVSEADAAAVVLNFVTAWQMIHRAAKVPALADPAGGAQAASAGREWTALVTGAAGGVGSAAVQLLRLAGVRVIGAAAKTKHERLRALGATPIDSRSGRLAALVHEAVPAGVDFAFDAVGGRSVGECLQALRRGGRLVGFGFMGAPSRLARLQTLVNVFLGSRLRGRRGAFYGITMQYRRDPQPFREDLPKIFALLAERRVDPLITERLPVLDARTALEHLASGNVQGKIVLEARA